MELKRLQDTPPWEWPEKTGEFFLGYLRDKKADPEDRAIAAELAGDYVVVNDEIAKTLLSIVRDSNENEELRGAAVISLGPALEHCDIEEFEDPDDILISEKLFREIRQSLRKLYTDAAVPEELRRRILEASVRAPEDWHTDAVRAAYVSDDEEWKLTGVFCMRFIKGFDKQIIEALKSKNQDVEYNAILAAGNWEVAAAWPHVLQMLTNPKTEKDMLLAAIEAAGTINPEQAAPLLHNFLESDDEDIAEEANEALVMAGILMEEGEFDDEEL
jgi:HEAT repeat protein